MKSGDLWMWIPGVGLALALVLFVMQELLRIEFGPAWYFILMLVLVPLIRLSPAVKPWGSTSTYRSAAEEWEAEGEAREGRIRAARSKRLAADETPGSDWQKKRKRLYARGRYSRSVRQSRKATREKRALERGKPHLTVDRK